MDSSSRMRITALAMLAGCALAPSTAVAQQRFATLGTGGVTGAYYAAGGAICRVMNKERKAYGLRCAVESTNGSVSNISAVRASDLDFGMAQSDVHYNAVRGVGQFREGPLLELRAVFSLHAEPFTVMARKEANVRAFADLKGKRFNVGVPGSGTRASLEELLANMGWKLSEFAQAGELRADEHGAALCDGKIDGFFFAVGHPSANIQEPAAACGARLVPLTGAGVERLMKDRPYYALATIPGGLYPNNPQSTQTYGVVATLVSSSRVSNDAVYALVKSVFDNFDEFRQQHPALATLDPRRMVVDGLSAPLHDGAMRYYREKSWLK